MFSEIGLKNCIRSPRLAPRSKKDFVRHKAGRPFQRQAAHLVQIFTGINSQQKPVDGLPLGMGELGHGGPPFVSLCGYYTMNTKCEWYNGQFRRLPRSGEADALREVGIITALRLLYHKSAPGQRYQPVRRPGTCWPKSSNRASSQSRVIAFAPALRAMLRVTKHRPPRAAKTQNTLKRRMFHHAYHHRLHPARTASACPANLRSTSRPGCSGRSGPTIGATAQSPPSRYSPTWPMPSHSSSPSPWV